MYTDRVTNVSQLSDEKFYNFIRQYEKRWKSDPRFVGSRLPSFNSLYYINNAPCCPAHAFNFNSFLISSPIAALICSERPVRSPAATWAIVHILELSFVNRVAPACALLQLVLKCLLNISVKFLKVAQLCKVISLTYVIRVDIFEGWPHVRRQARVSQCLKTLNIRPVVHWGVFRNHAPVWFVVHVLRS